MGSFEMLGEVRTCFRCQQKQPADNLFCQSCASPLLEGRMAGEYKLDHVLGEGGMGVVCMGYGSDGQEVAVKLLKPELAKREDTNRRFFREACITTNLYHPSIVRSFAVGTMEPFGTYLVMEYLRGTSLEQRIRPHTPMTWQETLALALPVCEAMAHAHEFGVVHRDLKPDNIILASDPEGQERPKVMDFGLAQSIHSDLLTRLTKPGSVIGTPTYMAPEQFRGELGQPTTDIYAVGLILYELLTGHRPHKGETVVSLIGQRMFPHKPALLSEYVKEYENTLLETTVAACLQWKPEQRLQSMERLDFLLKEARRELLGGPRGHYIELMQTQPEAEYFPLTNLEALNTSSFVGRKQELEQLQEVFQVRLCTIHGTGGLGKTRLACEFGRLHLDDYPGGVWFCDLTEVKDLMALCSAVAATLGVPLGKNDPVQLLGDALLGRGRVLLILDNFEQITSLASASISQWLHQTTDAMFLVTSRERLQLREEKVFQLGPLSREDGVELFVNRAKEAAPTFVLDGHRDTVEAIVERLDGISLAIELAAARTQRMAPSQILARLDQRFRLLHDKRQGIPTRQATMQGALDWSWDLMQPWERLAWAQCSIFHGGFTLDAVEAVLDLRAFPDAPWPMDAIDALCDKSLLFQLEHNRFAMFETIREYASHKLHDPTAVVTPRGEPLTGATPALEIALGHARYFSACGEEKYLGSLKTLLGEGRKKRLEKEWNNLLAAAHASEQAGEWELAARCLLAALPVFENRGPLQVGAQLPNALLQQTLLPSTRESLLLQQATLWRLAGEWSKAHDATKEALAHARQKGSKTTEAKGLMTMAQLTYTRKEKALAKAYAEESLALSQELGAKALEGSALSQMALIAKAEGEFTHSEELTKAAMKVYREEGYRKGETITMGHLAVILHDQGHLEEAKHYYKRGLRMFRELGEPRRASILMGNLANLYSNQGKHEKARPLYEAALHTHRILGYRLFEGITLGNLGVSLLRFDHPTDAATRLREAIDLLEEGQLHPVAEGSFRGAYGRTLQLLGQVDKGRAELERGESILRNAKNRLELGKLLCYRGLLEVADTQEESAQSYLEKAQAIATELNVQPSSELGKMLKELTQELTPAPHQIKSNQSPL